jgi:hypothetical protein
MFSSFFSKILITSVVVLLSCFALKAQADLTTLNSGVTNQPSGTTITWHSARPATTSNLLPNPTSVIAGIYYMAFYDGVNDCYSTNALAVPVLCPAGTADLTSLNASITNNPGTGVAISWHVALPADNSNVILNSTAVGPGIYYASFYDTVNVCYALAGTPVIVSNCSSVLLPIKIVDFFGKQQGLTNDLKWQTSSELNSDYFLLEKSIDGTSFEFVTKVEARGNVNMKTGYIFTDVNPFYGGTYYRLKMFELDGSYSYSKTIYIDFVVTSEKAILLYPNPAQDRLTLSYYTDGSSTLILEIIDVLGRVVEQKQVSVEKGINNFDLNLGGYTAGTYLLRTTDVMTVNAQLFVKQ